MVHCQSETATPHCTLRDVSGTRFTGKPYARAQPACMQQTIRVAPTWPHACAPPQMGARLSPCMHVDCTFANLGGDGRGCENCTAAISAGNTTVNVVNSTFFAPAPFRTSTYIRAWNGARVLLSGCRFDPGPKLSRSLFFTKNAVIYSDSEEAIAVRSDDAFAPLSQASPAAAVPAVPRGSPKAFLQRNDPWFVALLEVCLPELGSRARPVRTISHFLVEIYGIDCTIV